MKPKLFTEKKEPSLCECCGCSATDREVTYVRNEDMFLCAPCEQSRSHDWQVEQSWQYDQMCKFL